MSWLELRIQADVNTHSQVEDALFSAGALSVTTIDAADHPIFEPDPDNPPIWPDPVLVGLFDASVNQSAVGALVSAAAQLDSTQLFWEILEDRVWEKEWMKHFKPMHFGDNFWVYSEPVDEPAAQTLKLDPGLAFGTGTHPTTAMCIEWVVAHSCQDKQIIDYGCGSGVLGIAALLRGARHVHFVDIDPQALTATQNNLNNNAIGADQYQLDLVRAFSAPAADILLANILSGPLIDLAPELSALTRPQGRICLSGVLAEQAEDVAAAYRPWFSELEIQGRDEWRRITGKRRDG